MKQESYTARRSEDGKKIVIRLPRMEYLLMQDEARSLRDALTAILAAPAKPHGKCPMWLLELKGMAQAKAPLFSGLLRQEKGVPVWTRDGDLASWVENKWVAIVEGGFVITELGRSACEAYWREYASKPACGLRSK